MKVYSIFRSIDGEVNKAHQGRFSTFIRTAGCNLRCKYCDTRYAYGAEDGAEMSVQEIVLRVYELKCPKITITGGEPLLQPDFFSLTKALKRWSNDVQVSVETNGSCPLVGFGVDCWIVDYKLRNSGMRDKMNGKTFRDLCSRDFVKFVVGSLEDCVEAVEVREELESKGCKASFAFSPLHGELDPKELIQHLEQLKQFDVIVNLQLHKYIGLVEDK